MIKNTLKNHLIISMPHLNDTIFSKSVILINEFNDNGTMGFIINKPISKDISSSILFSDQFNDKIKDNIYFGGPVDLNSCFILHDKTYKLDNSEIITSNLYLTSNKQIIKDIEDKKGPEVFQFQIGYSGWDKGQLEKEIKNGDWLIIKNPDNFIFEVPNKKKWSYLINKLGINKNDDWLSSGGQA